MKKLLFFLYRCCSCVVAVIFLNGPVATAFPPDTSIQNRKLENQLVLLSSANTENEIHHIQRRQLMQQATTTTVALLGLAPQAAFAETITPDQAFANLVAGRDELILAAQKYLAKADWDGLTDYLQDPDRKINQYETNAQVLLQSKRLDIESKKAIGTIRRYGVGADVLIMYGGLRAELESPMGAVPNMNSVQTYMVRTLDSLEEVIVICRSNGFDKKEKN